jgi:2-hydroxy-6-oxonona-2,4-dienedioate hydrolase
MSPAEYIAALDRASTRCTTPLGSGHMVWRRWGQGAPLVLLHGGTGSWMHWIRNVESLSQQMMVVIPDLPGSGDSASPQPPFSAESIAAMLLQGLDEIIGAQTQFSIGGFSMGGLIAGYLAQQGESRVDALVLVGSTGMGGTRAQMEPLKSWRRLPTDEEKRAIHRMNLGILMIHDPQNIDALAVEVQSRNAAVSRIRGKHVSHTGSLANCLPGFTGRLAGIWGEHDPTAAPYLAERRERLQSFQPGAPFDIVPGAGHWVQYEAYETVNQRMRELLKKGE